MVILTILPDIRQPDNPVTDRPILCINGDKLAIKYISILFHLWFLTREQFMLEIDIQKILSIIYHNNTKLIMLQDIFRIPVLILPMVPTLDGNSDPHVMNNICYLICLRPFYQFENSHKSNIFSPKDLFSFMRALHFANLKVP